MAKCSDVILAGMTDETCLLKLRAASIVRQVRSSLIVSDKEMGEPAISTLLMLMSDLFRAEKDGLRLSRI